MRTLLLFLAVAGVAAAQGDVQVWAVPSLTKVRPDDRVERKNLVWNGAAKSIAIAGARNEHVPFQVVITTPPPAQPRHQPVAGGFFVEASDLVSPGGRIPRERIKLYFVHDILCYGKSSPAGATGFWPDALAPLTDPFSMVSEFRTAVKNRAVWIDVSTPADVPAGDYSGTVRVTQNGRAVDELKLNLTVWDFALPEETHLITYMGVSARQLASFHNIQPQSPEARDLLRRYHAFLYANRMEPWFNEALQPRVRTEGGKVSLQFDDAAYDLYLKQWRTKRVILQTAPRELSTRGEAYSDEAAARVRPYLTQVADYYKKHGWLDRLVFNSPIDEPATAQMFEDTRKWAALVHDAAPGVPFLATKSPAGGNPEWGPLAGHVNYFSVHGNELNRMAVKDAIRREQARGGEITWYISCDQVYPQPNYFIDAPAMDPVMVPWITWRYGMQGILYWEMKFWSQTSDPWVNPVTYLSGFLCSDGGVLNGEGSLIYPGSRVRRYTGQKDVDGPVSSIRFELLREGIEDYEYLWLLKSLGDPAAADEAARSMVVDVRAFSRNPEDLTALRARMAKRIVELSKARR